MPWFFSIIFTRNQQVDLFRPFGDCHECRRLLRVLQIPGRQQNDRQVRRAKNRCPLDDDCCSFFGSKWASLESIHSNVICMAIQYVLVSERYWEGIHLRRLAEAVDEAHLKHSLRAIIIFVSIWLCPYASLDRPKLRQFTEAPLPCVYFDSPTLESLAKPPCEWKLLQPFRLSSLDWTRSDREDASLLEAFGVKFMQTFRRRTAERRLIFENCPNRNSFLHRTAFLLFISNWQDLINSLSDKLFYWWDFSGKMFIKKVRYICEPSMVMVYIRLSLMKWPPPKKRSW